ncbi:hypothetical protein COBT_001847 [Conglomerata obtusa]
MFTCVFDKIHSLISRIAFCFYRRVKCIKYRWFCQITTSKKFPKKLTGISIYGKVVKVHDGDTFRFVHVPCITFFNKIKEISMSIRVYPIDTPELTFMNTKEQRFAIEAKHCLQNLIDNHYVRIKIVGIDKYDRLLAEVYVNGINASHVLLKEGLACLYEKRDIFDSNEDNVYKKLENFAKDNKYGIWGIPNYEIPQKFRARIRNEIESKRKIRKNKTK